MRRETEPINVGLVGCGAVARYYYAPALQNLARLGQLQVKGLFDPNQENRLELGRIFPEAKAFSQFSKETSDSCPLSLAIILSPARYHSEQSVLAMQLGMSVLCEKPMALSVCEGEVMLKAARETNRVLAFGLVRRLFPAAQFIYDVVNSKVLGKVETFRFVDGGHFAWQARSASLFDLKESGGGVLIDLGFHALDLLMWWFGAPQEFRYEDDAMGGVEANCRLELNYGGAMRGTVALSRDWQPESRCFVQCEKGWLRWELGNPQGIEIGFAGTSLSAKGQVSATDLPGMYPAPVEKIDLVQIFESQISKVISTMQGDEQKIVGAEDAIKTMDLIEKCYKSRTLMAMPWLSQDELAGAKKLASPSLIC